MKCKRTPNNDRGFTLIEILAAVAIMGISLVTVIGLQIKTIRLQQISNRITVGTLLASQVLTDKMDEITRESSPSLTYEEGDFEEEDYQDYHWEYTLTSMPNADTLYQIDLITYWDADHKESHSVTLTSLISVGP